MRVQEDPTVGKDNTKHPGMQTPLSKRPGRISGLNGRGVRFPGEAEDPGLEAGEIDSPGREKRVRGNPEGSLSEAGRERSSSMGNGDHTGILFPRTLRHRRIDAEGDRSRSTMRGNVHHGVRSL